MQNKNILSSFKDVLCCQTVWDLPKAHLVPQDPSNTDSKGTLVSKADKKSGFQASWWHLWFSKTMTKKFLTVGSTASDVQPKFCLMSLDLGTPCFVATALCKTSTCYYSKILNLLKVKENATTFQHASCNKILPSKIINFPFFFCQEYTGKQPYLWEGYFSFIKEIMKFSTFWSVSVTRSTGELLVITDISSLSAPRIIC